MIAVRRLIILSGTLALFVMSCGNKTEKPPARSMSDEQLIQETLTEAITRWHYGDKAALYDNEFEYLQERFTFDDYLKFGELQLDADTVEGIEANKIEIFARDSAKVEAQIIFKGPTGKISRMNDTYWLYYHRGRWIRPTLSRFDQQLLYERSRRAADSAAEAEAKELGDE